MTTHKQPQEAAYLFTRELIYKLNTSSLSHGEDLTGMASPQKQNKTCRLKPTSSGRALTNLNTYMNHPEVGFAQILTQ